MFARSPWRPLRKNAFIRTKQMTGVIFYRLLNRITVLRWYLYTHTITTASFYTPVNKNIDIRFAYIGNNLKEKLGNIGNPYLVVLVRIPGPQVNRLLFNMHSDQAEASHL